MSPDIQKGVESQEKFLHVDHIQEPKGEEGHTFSSERIFCKKITPGSLEGIYKLSTVKTKGEKEYLLNASRRLTVSYGFIAPFFYKFFS
jgi:hypothetical protein